eukprot:scaffold633124_cov63-Attheya_sp.AAC.1
MRKQPKQQREMRRRRRCERRRREQGARRLLVLIRCSSGAHRERKDVVYALLGRCASSLYRYGWREEDG